MEGKSYHYLFLFIGLFLCLFQNVNGETPRCTVRRLYTGRFRPDSKSIYNHGEEMIFYCYTGFEKEHNTRYWCDSGDAVPSIPRCIKTARACSAPNLPEHMTPSQSRFPHDMILGVSCEYGFQLTDHELPRCLEGSWNRPLAATCQRVPCGPPVRASHSTIGILPVPGVQGYVHGTRVRYSCSEGWEIEGTAERECDNGQWTGFTPECRVSGATCEELHPPTNGNKMGGNRVGDSVLIGCNQGYQLQGEPFLDCQESGNWSHPLPACVGVSECVLPSPTPSIEIEEPSELSSFGGYSEGATCEELRPPTHGIKMGGNRVGDSVLIACNQGYQLQGEPLLNCQESGNWSHPLPACVAQEPVDVQTPGT